MALSDQERDRIREEEWVRLQAREDFYKSNPGFGPAWGPGWRGNRPRVHPGFVLGVVAILMLGVVLTNVAERINWNHFLP